MSFGASDESTVTAAWADDDGSAVGVGWVVDGDGGVGGLEGAVSDGGVIGPEGDFFWFWRGVGGVGVGGEGGEGEGEKERAEVGSVHWWIGVACLGGVRQGESWPSGWGGRMAMAESWVVRTTQLSYHWAIRPSVRGLNSPPQAGTEAPTRCFSCPLNFQGSRQATLKFDKWKTAAGRLGHRKVGRSPEREIWLENVRKGIFTMGRVLGDLGDGEDISRGVMG